MDDRPGDSQATDPVLKDKDAWWTVVFVDPLAAPLARRLRDVSWVTPLGLTATAHLLGVVSAGLFVIGWLVPAAVLFEIRFVIDCVDGKLARLRRSPSAAGAFLDYVGDYLVVALNLVAFTSWAVAEADLPIGLAVVGPTVYVTHIAAGQAAATQSLRFGTPVALLSDSVSAGYRRWMKRRRLKPLPSRIEVEHGLLFVAPLLTVLSGSTTPAVVALWGAAVYFGAQTLHITRLGWRVACAVDERASDNR